MRTQQLLGQKAAQQPSFTAVQAGLLQRQCDCGQHTGGGECEECRQKIEGTIQRTAVNAEPMTSVPPIVHEVLSSPRQPLDTGTRGLMEPRFSYDFSHVRVHNSMPTMIQTKLRVSQPGDKYEQEADQVAEQVMRMPETPQSIGALGQSQGIPIQRRCSECDEEIHRQPIEEEEEEEESLQAKESPGQTPKVVPELHGHINSIREGGHPLSMSVRAFMEPRFGYNFSQVRVYTDTQAAETARRVKARAYTIGQDVVFGTGEYAPETEEGRRLLAHELAHVVQQSGQIGTKEILSNPSTPITMMDNYASNSNAHGRNIYSPERRIFQFSSSMPTIFRTVASGMTNCRSNRNGVPTNVNPIDVLRTADSKAERITTLVSTYLDLESVRPVHTSATFGAYSRYFGLPPRRSGGFLNRLSGRVRPTQDAAIGGEFETLSKRFEYMARIFRRNVNYGCLAGRGSYGGIQVTRLGAYAWSRPGSNVIILCPGFWDTNITRDQQAEILIHEAAHITSSSNVVGDQPWVGSGGNFHMAECYASFVANIMGFTSVVAPCPTQTP